ncbi:Tau-tubulin kinase [Trichinella pseudospiralis]
MASDSEDGKVENFKPGECIDERWIVEKLLGVGGCASVYQVKDAVTNSINAMKVEMAAQKVDILKFEMTVMIELNKVNDRHVCKVVGGGKNAAFCYIVMTLVGPNFFTILNSLKRKSTDRSRPKFSTRSSVFLALNSLEALQDLHQCGYLHRDIKPQNFAIGHALKGEEQSRKDDVWSWFFMMIRLSTGTIAWKGYVPPKHIPPFKQMEEYSKIKETALSNMKEFCKHCPEEFCNIGEHLKTLGYFDKPNYELCYENMNAISKRMGLEDLPLDWEPQEKRQEQKSTGEEQKSNKEQKPDDKKVIKSLLKPQDQ